MAPLVNADGGDRMTASLTQRGDLKGAVDGPEQVDAYRLLRALLGALGPSDNPVTCGDSIAANLDAESPLWSQLVAETDYHGLTLLVEPIIAALLELKPDAISTDARRAFFALASRHRRFAAARETAIDRLLAAFEAAGVRAILLKGAALAHRIYPAPELRPMLDIDVLIDPSQAEAAVVAASSMGYVFAPRHSSRFAGRLHHIPVAEITEAGFQIFLEIHVDAMHLDQPYRLTVSDLASPPQCFSRGAGCDGLALGHIDMLRHLAGHAFDPAHRIRLIHLYDIWRYQSAFSDEIDWKDIEARFSHVAVVLGLVQQVFAIDPASMSRADSGPAGLGNAMLPLADILAADMNGRARFAALFLPPPWWMHGFYGVPAERSLLRCRLVQHPLTVLRWLLARGAGFSGLAGNWNWVAGATNRRGGSEKNP
jgi:hypothetical protein